MKFKTVQEAFNYYNNQPADAIEKRAAEIEKEIAENPSADMDALNMELRAMKDVRENREKRSAANSILSMIAGTNAAPTEKTFGDDVLNTKEYRSAFYKHLMNKQLTDVEKRAFDAGMEKRANGVTTSTSAAAVIPTETMNEVVKKAANEYGIFADARVFTLPANVSIPVSTPATKASWHAEGAAVSAEEVNPTSVTFSANEIVKIFSLSAKTQATSISSFESYLAEELQESVFDCLGDACVNGTGEDQGTGIIAGITWGANNMKTVAKGGTIKYADVVATAALLKRGYAAGAKWYMNNATLYNVFYGMVDDNKRPVFIQDPQGDKIGKILGHEVAIDEALADNDVIFGDASRYFGVSLPAGGIIVESSRESSFRNNLIDYRAAALADCKPIVADAFARLTIATA
jgi:HK97 family phage major capsid protein